MRIIVTIFFLFIAEICFGQKQLIGLFGKCDKRNAAYICEQVQFKRDKTLIFYDLLHLRGWTLTEGLWELKGDTVVINSKIRPYELIFKGRSVSENISICVTDSAKPLSYAGLVIHGRMLKTNEQGVVKILRRLVDTLNISYISSYAGLIIINAAQLKNTDTLEIRMDTGPYKKVYFTNAKWLLQNRKLYYSRDSLGNYDREKYFDKVSMRGFKYVTEK